MTEMTAIELDTHRKWLDLVMSRKLVVLESPYAGDRARNDRYLKQAMRDSLSRGEAPMASHMLYTACLDDTIPDERQLGIACGLAWGRWASATVVYRDLGISSGMRLGIDRAYADGRAVEYRELGGVWSIRP